MMTLPSYSAWLDHRTGSWTVLRWNGPTLDAVPVQSNILTHEKALQALAEWRARQAEKEQS